MRVSLHGGFLILIAVLQKTWLNCIEIMGVKPNLFLVYVLILSFFCSKTEATVLGLIYGFIMDVLIGKFLGLNTVMCGILGFFTAHFCDRMLSHKNVFVVALYAVAATVVYEFINYIVSFLILGGVDLIYAFKGVILIECVYNGIASMLIYPLLKKLTKYMYADKGEIIG